MDIYSKKVVVIVDVFRNANLEEPLTIGVIFMVEKASKVD